METCVLYCILPYLSVYKYLILLIYFYLFLPDLILFYIILILHQSARQMPQCLPYLAWNGTWFWIWFWRPPSAPTLSELFGILRSENLTFSFLFLQISSKLSSVMRLCVCIYKQALSSAWPCVFMWLDVVVGKLFSPSVCTPKRSPHEIFKVQWKLICWSEVCFSSLSLPLSDQIPVELPGRRILRSYIS